MTLKPLTKSLIATSFLLLIIALVSLSLVSYSTSIEQPSTPFLDLQDAKSNLVLTPEEKISQLFAVPLSAPNVHDFVDAENFKPGFIGLFDTEDLARNSIVRVIKQLNLHPEVILSDHIPPLVFLDYEGGRVNRLRTYWGDAEDLEHLCQNLTAQEMFAKGERIGKTFPKALGLDGIWGPVVDRTNPKSSVLKTRTCSDDPKEIIEKVGAHIQGVEQQGLMTVIKHYPGLGGTHLDPHLTLGTVKDIDLEVFIPLISSASGVMVTHVKVGDDQLPCTLSSKCLAPLNHLRSTTNPDLLIFSDDLGMSAIEDNYSDFEAAYLAIMAGIDILIYGRGFDYTRLFTLQDQLTTQYDQDPYFQSRVDESLTRILKIKKNRGPKSLPDIVVPDIPD